MDLALRKIDLGADWSNRNILKFHKFVPFIYLVILSLLISICGNYFKKWYPISVVRKYGLSLIIYIIIIIILDSKVMAPL